MRSFSLGIFSFLQFIRVPVGKEECIFLPIINIIISVLPMKICKMLLCKDEIKTIWHLVHMRNTSNQLIHLHMLRWLREKKDTIPILIIKWRLFVQSRISFIQKRFVLSFVEYGPVVLEKKVKMKKRVAPHSNNREFPSLIIKDSFGKFGWNWTGGFGEEDENVKCLWRC